MATNTQARTPETETNGQNPAQTLQRVLDEARENHRRVLAQLSEGGSPEQIGTLVAELNTLNGQIKSLEARLPEANMQNTVEVKSLIKDFITTNPVCLTYFRSGGKSMTARYENGTLIVDTRAPRQQKTDESGNKVPRTRTTRVLATWGEQKLSKLSPIKRMVPQRAGETEAQWKERVVGMNIGVTFHD